MWRRRGGRGSGRCPNGRRWRRKKRHRRNKNLYIGGYNFLNLSCIHCRKYTLCNILIDEQPSARAGRRRRRGEDHRVGRVQELHLVGVSHVWEGQEDLVGLGFDVVHAQLSEAVMDPLSDGVAVGAAGSGIWNENNRSP